MIHNGTLKSFVGSRTTSFLILVNTGLLRKDETLKTKIKKKFTYGRTSVLGVKPANKNHVKVEFKFIFAIQK